MRLAVLAENVLLAQKEQKLILTVLLVILGGFLQLDHQVAQNVPR